MASTSEAPDGPLQAALGVESVLSSTESHEAPAGEHGAWFAGRYRVEQELGRGARGVVYLAFDEQQQHPVALKRSLPSGDLRKDEQYHAALRREYAMLLQLAHPNLVQAYDFDTHDGAPFFTMEYLSGEHPGARGPMSVRAACRMLVGLCQPLAHLHARGWVHRDLSARNVKLQPSGAVKLLDLGALAAADAQHRQLGAPACMAPETLNKERIDARTDLYGLGALGYFALTGEHAYPARALSQLPTLWQIAPRRPSEFIQTIPSALDELILSLLCLDIEARPRQLREVVQRLLPFAQLPETVAGDAAQACLLRPALVGRDRELSQLRTLLAAPAPARAALYAIQGEHGSGCSRLLDALVQQARDAGFTPIRLDVRSCEPLPFALIVELEHALRHLLSDAPLATLVQPSAAPMPLDPADDAEHASFLSLCRRALERGPLLLALDSVERADAGSLHLLTQLARMEAPQRLAIALSLSATSDEHPALQALCRDAWWFRLAPLPFADTQRLLITLFGDVPNIARVAQWTQQLGAGMPGATVAAAQALVAAGAARFVLGQWQLPDRVDPDALSSQGDLLDASAELSATAQELLCLLSLVTSPPPLELAAYHTALGLSETDSALAEGELYAARILISTGMSYTVRDPSVLERAKQRLDPTTHCSLQLQLSRFYARRGLSLPAAYHALRAQDLASADELLQQALREPAATGPTGFWTLRFTLSEPAAELYEALYLRRRSLGAAPHELHELRVRLMLTAATSRSELVKYAPEILARLRFDAGLDQWDSCAPEADPRARCVQCMRSASERNERAEPHDRGVSSEVAIAAIGTIVVALANVYSLRCDAAGALSLSAVIEPLSCLSLPLQLIAQVAAVAAAVTARGSAARETRARILAATSSSVPGLDEALRAALHFYTAFYLGLDYAGCADPYALELADTLAKRRGLAALALQVRRIYALARGQYEHAEQLRREREQCALEHSLHDKQLELSELSELRAVAQCRDLLEVTRISARCRARGEQAPGWLAHAALGAAYASLLSDEPERAARHAAAALTGLTPFGHAAYLDLCCVLAEAQIELGQHGAARDTIDRLVRDAEPLGLQIHPLHRAHALRAVALAGLGQRAPSLEALDGLIRRHAECFGDNNVRFGLLCEARMQASCMFRDYPGFSEHLERLEPLYASYPSLRARHARWVRSGRERFSKLIAVLDRTPARAAWADRIQAELRVSGTVDHGSHLLSLVLSELGLAAGQLFRVDEAGDAQLMAARPIPADPVLSAAAARCIAAWTDVWEPTTADDADALQLADGSGRPHVPLWLTHSADPERLVGFLLLPCLPAHLGKLSVAFVRALGHQLEALSGAATPEPGVNDARAARRG